MIADLRVKFPAAALLCGALLSTAWAATLGELFPADAEACFAVRFDERQLAGTDRRVGAVHLYAAPQPGDNAQPAAARELIIFELSVTPRGSPNPLKAAGVICHRMADEVWTCNEHVCNGRPVSLKAESRDVLVLDLRDRRGGAVRPGSLTTRGACGSEDVEKQQELKLGASDQVFRLRRSPRAGCN